MKKWPWKMIVAGLGWLMLVAGVVPGAYVLVRLGKAPAPKPLSAPVSLKQGQFASPFFRPETNHAYLIDLAWDLLPARQTSVDLDWKVVADNGSVLQQGTFLNILRGANTVDLGSYRPNAGQREQVVLNVHADVDQGGAHARLEVGPPDTAAELSELIPLAAGSAALIAIPGALLLIILAITDSRQRKRASERRRPSARA